MLGALALWRLDSWLLELEGRIALLQGLAVASAILWSQEDDCKEPDRAAQVDTASLRSHPPHCLFLEEAPGCKDRFAAVSSKK